MTDLDKKLHFISVTGIIIKDGKFLIVKRSEKEKTFANRWLVPGGKLHIDDYINTEKNKDGLWYEVLEKALRREIQEEVGLEIDNFRYLTSITFVRPDGIPTLIVSLICDYKDGEVNLSDELSDHAWVNIEEAKNYDLVDGMYDELKMTHNFLNN
ncbi:MAG: NUDIX domain-containing protein [Candidatus Hodarchaeales archaeon]|jgi:8-oxo-dGTP pyrophosphatase MutT (NUDIX family)